MNKLSIQKRAQILGFLVEGNNMRASSRLADCFFNTVMKFLVNLGRAVLAFQDKTYINLPCKRIEIDEIWSFCYAKAKNSNTLAGRILLLRPNFNVFKDFKIK